MRLSKGWSQNMLSQKSGVSQSTISKLETDKRKWGGCYKSMKKIAVAFGVTMEYLEDEQ
ncbi:helix-turn-helix domain-containing protein [Paenibacillus sp. Soil522]|uniref:helix-turn-helix domain-containing protein n=1 Tax=Paenibacillus sp. Soil522 TaxID=1736388 RepID=UPI002285900A|nr:helix-turn-helix transcriptional regulator [Paenibacillus sp. Soil522]